MKKTTRYIIVAEKRGVYLGDSVFALDVRGVWDKAVTFNAEAAAMSAAQGIFLQELFRIVPVHLGNLSCFATVEECVSAGCLFSSLSEDDLGSRIWLIIMMGFQGLPISSSIHPAASDHPRDQPPDLGRDPGSVGWKLDVTKLRIMHMMDTVLRSAGQSAGNWSVTPETADGRFWVRMEWWQLHGMRPQKCGLNLGMIDELQLSHAVRSLAVALLVRAMGQWCKHSGDHDE